MNILTISTLYNKGGAAYIAKTLHEGFRDFGHNTKYLYGYGRNGYKNKVDDNNLISADYTFKFTPHLNFLTHKLIGKEFFGPKITQLTTEIQWADTIVCHTLHSFFSNYERIFNALKSNANGRKIFFVAHDSWHYTGRCAFKFECEGWKMGCRKCPHTNYYPSAFFSISGNEWINKHNAIEQIPGLSFISPAKWIYDDLKIAYPKIPVSLIRNGIDVASFNKVPVYLKNDEISLCVSSVDLSQEGKVNLVLVKNLLDEGLKIHFIGKNNPLADHPNAVNHGYITERDEYMRILSLADCYLFSSIVDIYPTVLIDALCAGKYIFYTGSKGSEEIMEAENTWLGSKIFTAEDVKLIVAKEEFRNIIYNDTSRELMRLKAIDFFHNQKMVASYLELFGA